MKKKIKYFVFIIIIGILIIPKPASADIWGILDSVGISLGGVEEFSAMVAKYIFLFFFIYIVSITSLYTSASLLQLTTENPQWLSVYNNDMVRSGWYFTSGIANMLIILILMVIALSFILKRETFEIKKTLPKLLMVALLINFSLVFVGALVDISNIIFKTILDGNKNLPFQIIDALGVGMWGIATSLIVWIIALVVAFAVPFVSSFAQLALVTGFVSIVFLPNILIWLFQIFSSFSTSILFFTYAFLFGARIFIIQILAIVSPLAFLCSILPQTEKYWKEWLNHLLQWLFFGIALFFFLVIGLRATSWIMPPGVSYPLVNTPFSWFALDGYFVYYFFLFIYLAVAGWISKKAMPTVATAIIAQANSFGGMMMKAAKPIKKMAGGIVGGAAREAAITQKGVEEKWQGVKGLKGWAGRRYAGARKWAVAKPTRWAYRRAGTTPEMAAVARKESKAVRAEEARKKIEGQTEETQRAELQAALKRKDDSRAVGIMEAMLKDKTLSKAEKDGLVTEKQITEYMGIADNMGRKQLKLHNVEAAAELDTRWKDADEADKERRKKEIISEMLAKTKPSDVKLMGEKSLTNDMVKEAMVDTFNGNQMAEFGKNFGRDIVDGIQETIQARKTAVGIAKKNPNLALWLHGNAAQNLGLNLPGKALERNEIKKIVSRKRKSIAGVRKMEKRRAQEQQAPAQQQAEAEETAGQAEDILE